MLQGGFAPSLYFSLSLSSWLTVTLIWLLRCGKSRPNSELLVFGVLSSSSIVQGPLKAACSTAMVRSCVCERTIPLFPFPACSVLSAHCLAISNIVKRGNFMGLCRTGATAERAGWLGIGESTKCGPSDDYDILDTRSMAYTMDSSNICLCNISLMYIWKYCEGIPVMSHRMQVKRCRFVPLRKGLKEGMAVGIVDKDVRTQSISPGRHNNNDHWHAQTSFFALWHNIVTKGRR